MEKYIFICIFIIEQYDVKFLEITFKLKKRIINFPN